MGSEMCIRDRVLVSEKPDQFFASVISSVPRFRNLDFGPVAKLWLMGQPYISFVDCDDIAEVNMKAILHVVPV